MELVSLSANQLREAASLKEQIDVLQERLSNLLTGKSFGQSQPVTPGRQGRTGPRGPMDDETKAKIAARLKAAWDRKKAAPAPVAAPVAAPAPEVKPEQVAVAA